MEEFTDLLHQKVILEQELTGAKKEHTITRIQNKLDDINNKLDKIIEGLGE